MFTTALHRIIPDNSLYNDAACSISVTCKAAYYKLAYQHLWYVEADILAMLIGLQRVALHAHQGLLHRWRSVSLSLEMQTDLLQSSKSSIS